MNRVSLSRWLTVLTGSVVPAFAQITPQDTTGPNIFYFPSETWFASVNATSVTVEVSFYPGNRSWSGSVNYRTEDGTAVAGTDYTPVAGTLTWSGPTVRSFVVPLQPSTSLVDRTLTVRLLATETNCVLTRDHATLVLPAVPPALSIASGQDRTVRLSWPTIYTNYMIETASGTTTDPGAWSSFTGSPALVNDEFVVEFVPDQPSRLFRLRKQSPPAL
jgi:hypothetical protein